jgi:hypothetical protein
MFKKIPKFNILLWKSEFIRFLQNAPVNRENETSPRGRQGRDPQEASSDAMDIEEPIVNNLDTNLNGEFQSVSLKVLTETFAASLASTRNSTNYFSDKLKEIVILSQKCIV